VYINVEVVCAVETLHSKEEKGQAPCQYSETLNRLNRMHSGARCCLILLTVTLCMYVHTYKHTTSCVYTDLQPIAC
jgi:hypothetical protein